MEHPNAAVRLFAFFVFAAIFYSSGVVYGANGPHASSMTILSCHMESVKASNAAQAGVTLNNGGRVQVYLLRDGAKGAVIGPRQFNSLRQRVEWEKPSWIIGGTYQVPAQQYFQISPEPYGNRRFYDLSYWDTSYNQLKLATLDCASSL